MEKLSTLLFAAGLALTGCSSTPIDRCKQFTKEGNLLGIHKSSRENFRDNKCSDLKNEAAREHCKSLMVTIQQKVMSACVTRQTAKPMDCKLTNDEWSCKQVNK